MKILIIGSNGFLGKELFQFFQNNNFEVYGTSHHIQEKRNIFYMDVEKEFNDELLNISFNAIIYLVHVYDISKKEQLISWYKETFMRLSKNSAKQIYISSYSANEYAISDYGTVKYEIEKFFINNGGCSISPGLIIGEGGIYSKIKKLVTILPMVPLPVNKDANLLPIIKVDELCEVINKITIHNCKMTNYNIFSDKITLEEFTKEIMLKHKVNKKILKINANLVLKIMIFIEKFGIILPVNSDSLSGFVANQKYDVASDINKI